MYAGADRKEPEQALDNYDAVELGKRTNVLVLQQLGTSRRERWELGR